MNLEAATKVFINRLQGAVVEALFYLWKKQYRKKPAYKKLNLSI